MKLRKNSGDKLDKIKSAGFPLVKVQELPDGSMIVFGQVTAQVQDHDGETCHYESTKDEYLKARDSFAKSSGGDNIMPIREMHQLSAVGAGKDLLFDDANKQILLRSKIVDPTACMKVREKVYRGYSQGGQYQKKWAEGNTQFYTATPGEVSLVDNPCLASALFEQEYVKADGSVEMRKVEGGVSKSVKYLAPGGHLPYTDDSGKPDHRHMGAAWAALHGGYRGNKYQGPGRAKAIAHLKEIYHSEGLEPPSEKAMLEDMRKYLDSLELEDSELDTESKKLSALIAEVMGKQSAATGAEMNKTQIEACAKALGITAEEFTKTFIDGEVLLKGKGGLAALHAHLKKAVALHDKMHTMHKAMAEHHAALGAHLENCMKAHGACMDGAEADKILRAAAEGLEKVEKKEPVVTKTDAEIAEMVKAQVAEGLKAMKTEIENQKVQGVRVIPRMSDEEFGKARQGKTAAELMDPMAV